VDIALIRGARADHRVFSPSVSSLFEQQATRIFRLVLCIDFISTCSHIGLSVRRRNHYQARNGV
jgi:hypothetical protein